MSEQVGIRQGSRRPVRQLVAASIGNAVEWYDWYAYTFLATYFSAQVFPNTAGDPLVPLLSAFAVFAVGFFLRPIGGLLLGSVADRVGRRNALTLTILMMGAGSLLMAVLPTYASVGLLAPALLVLAWLLQGLSIGGGGARVVRTRGLLAVARDRAPAARLAPVTVMA